MRKLDELDELIGEFEKGSVDRRTFMKRAVALGLTLSSISAFMSSSGVTGNALAQTPPPGKPVNVGVGYFPSWVGGWSGAVIKHKELWKQYLPAGSKIDWDVHVVGAPVANNLLAGKLQIGYLGDTPGFVATTKRSMADLRIVSINIFSNTGQICADMLLRSDAPQFKSVDETIKWLNGKKIGVSGKGSCGDRFVSGLVKRYNIKAEIQYLDPTIIKTVLQSKKVDAAQSFQPHVAQISEGGQGRIAFTGTEWGWQEGSVILMRKDFIDSQREIAKGWLKADIEALQFMLKNPYETVKLIARDLPGFSTKDLWLALYGRYHEDIKSSDINAVAQVPFDKQIMEYIDEAFKFLNSIGAVTVDKPMQGAIYPELLDQVVKETGVKLPLGQFKGRPLSEFKG
jgi:NitT/TauT family transport system substrate-binding protein